jgi:hypothetical protein
MSGKVARPTDQGIQAKMERSHLEFFNRGIFMQTQQGEKPNDIDPLLLK